jgi:leucyl aminopeptidase (aminopeptidase T)
VGGEGRAIQINVEPGATLNVYAERYAAAVVRADYEEYRFKAGEDAFDIWYSRHKYPDGLSPRQKQEALEARARIWLRELESEAQASGMLLDDYILTKYEGDLGKAFRLESSDKEKVE